MKVQDSQIQLKNYNRRMVLHYIRRNVHATKAGLASVTGLTFMAIKKILEELESLDLIRTDELEIGGVGRRAATYMINEKFGYMVGIHVNVFRTKAAIMDMHGKILESESCDMSQSITEPEEFVKMIETLANGVIERSGADKDKILGVGLGVPGPVDSNEGIVLTPPNLPVLRYLPLKQILEEKLGYKTYLNKDTNAIAMGEYWRGAGIGYSNIVYVDVDMGIGSGLVVNGKLNQGANCFAGEFGHITLDINGPLCNCGNKGCLEAIGSGLSVLREYRERILENPEHPLYVRRDVLTIQDILDASEKNDLLSISLLNKSAFYVGVAVNSLVNILDPSLVIMGGILIQKCPRYYEVAKDAALSRRMKGVRENEIVISKLKGNAGVLGAGEMVAEHFFEEVVNQILAKN